MIKGCFDALVELLPWHLLWNYGSDSETAQDCWCFGRDSK